MQAKLAVIPGGVHKHLVALTRLAFSEGLVLERAIDDEVVELARGLLEEGISLEEGEELGRAFGGEGGGGGDADGDGGEDEGEEG